jgi:hypothetical protein
MKPRSAAPTEGEGKAKNMWPERTGRPDGRHDGGGGGGGGGDELGNLPKPHELYTERDSYN